MGRHRGWLRKIRFADGQASTTPRRVMVMTDGRTGTGHRVTDQAFAAGRRAGGCYLAACGLPVFSASLTAPAREHCARCELVRDGGEVGGGR